MEDMASFGIIAGILGVVLFIVLLKQRAQLVLQVFVRLALGAICIFFTNNFLAGQGIAWEVGINPVSLLTVGVLGISGFVLLYGIVACNFL